jgi:hypothetical protein
MRNLIAGGEPERDRASRAGMIDRIPDIERRLR